MELMDKFMHWYDGRHVYAQEWKKKTGGKVLGCLCTYVPEEILYAADILPVRVFGGHEPPSVAEPYMFAGLQCPHSRCCLAEGVRGRYDYLDGILLPNTCLTERPIFFSWVKHIKVDYHYYIMMPHGTQTKGIYKYITAELNAFKESLEKWTGKKITDADLDRGIEIMNTNRSLMREVWDFRKMDDPPLTGVESMGIALSEQVTDKREHTEALKELLKELPNRKLDRETGNRLMLVGSEHEDIEFVKMVEEEMSLPATVVIEEGCNGSRYFWGNVVPQENRITAIGSRYVDRIPCPGKDWPVAKRLAQVLNLAREWKVDGVITFQQKLCEPHELDIPVMRKMLEDNGFPTYFLEFDVTVPAGQFRTRVEAFLETMIDLV